jgi:aspartyl-tRNA(Asn)/glutamyl-tRNA(Gln) amidotransferase subunit A
MTAASTAQTNLIHYLDATTLAALIRTKQLSSREVVQAHLDRVAAVNPKINAVVTLMADDALKSADAADKMVARARFWTPCTASRSPSRIHWIRQAS